MDRPAADERDEVVAGLLERERAFDEHAMVAGELDRARVAQEVRGVEEVHVQRVALDPLAAVQQAAQGANGRVELDRRRRPRTRGPRSSGRRPGRCRRCGRRCRGPRPACGRGRGARSSAAPRRSRGGPRRPRRRWTTSRSEPSPSTRVRPSTSNVWVFVRRLVVARGHRLASGFWRMGRAGAGRRAGRAAVRVDDGSERLGPGGEARRSACWRLDVVEAGRVGEPGWSTLASPRGPKQP